MLRTSTPAAGLLFLGLLHSLQVIAPGWAIDGEWIVILCGEECEDVTACDKCRQEKRRGDETYYSVSFVPVLPPPPTPPSLSGPHMNIKASHFYSL